MIALGVALVVSIAANVAVIALALAHVKARGHGLTGEVRAIRRHLETNNPALEEGQ